MCVEASAGNVEIQVSPEQKIDVVYTKVGTWENGHLVLEEIFAKSGLDLNNLKRNSDTKQVIEILESFQEMPTGRISTVKGTAHIQNLEEGVYLMQGISSKNYEVQSTLISVPTWDSAMGEMNYEIQWMPKINAVMKGAATGDANPIVLILIICAISLLFIVRTLYFSLRLC